MIFHSFNAQSNELIIKFNYAFLDFNIIDNKEMVSFPMKTILNSKSKEYLNELENGWPGIGNWQITKIFPFLTTKDTISISRLGEKVTIPPFWAAFTLSAPQTENLQKLISELNFASPLIEYCHYNFTAYLESAPSDTLYNQQISLNGSALHPNAGINIEDAWTIETGKSFVKVGIHDSGIDTLHPDLKVLFGGAYLEPDNSTNFGWGEDTKNHGTPVAGIIGAKRNNLTGIAGIAGGDSIVSSGCSLIDFRLNFYNQNLASFICASVVDAARSVGTYWDYPDNYYESSYFNNTPGFGVHIGNHSYIIKTNVPIPQDPNGGIISKNAAENTKKVSELIIKSINDSTAVNVPECKLCREAYLFSYKNGVINVVSRGNSQHFNPSLDPTLIDFSYPQSFPDNWIISVGASGYDGNTVQQGLNQSTLEAISSYWSMYGGNMDLIAPGSDSIVYTTNIINSSTSANPYEKFNGTSAAAPHVSGVVALLLSHYNKPDCYSNKNLAVEDVEYILEHSATNLYGPGYDDTTGWGRLDAYKALQMIENTTLQILHPDSLITREIVSMDTISINYANAFVADGWGPISRPFPLENNKYYQVERVLVKNTYSFDEYMSPGTELLDVWSRPSASNALDYYEDYDSTYGGPQQPLNLTFDELEYMPYQNVVFVDSTNYKVEIEGYYYHVIARYDEAFFPILSVDPVYPIDEWLPTDPINIGSKMLFSIYIKNDSLTSYYDFPCDSANVLYDQNLGLSDIENISQEIILFPNPSEDYITIRNLGNNTFSQIIIRDINGKIVFDDKFSSNQTKIDINNLGKGVYLIDCKGENFNRTLKFIKL